MFGRFFTLLGISTATLLLASGCGGGSDGEDGSTAPDIGDIGDQADQSLITGTPGATGRFSVTGEISMSGTLDNVLCMVNSAGDYSVQGTTDTAQGKVTVGAEVGGDGSNSLLVGKTLYNRTSMGGKPLSGHRDHEELTVVAQLVNMHDPLNPDLIDHHDQWRTVTVTSHWDCAGALAKGDKAVKMLQGSNDE